MARHLLRWLLKRPNSTVLVQNPDDYAVVAGLGVPKQSIALIAGSGVDVDVLTPLPEPPGPFTVGYVGRLLDDKGVRTLVRAHELLAQRGIVINTLLAGEPDPSNPASIPENVLANWRLIPNLRLVGHVDDVRAVWSQAHVAILPSRREGLPLSLLEAAACGRPLIATDVPGCREIARNGVNALLVPWDNPEALAEAIERLMKDRDLRARFGAASRQIAVSEYSSRRIASDTAALYARLLDSALSPKLQTAELFSGDSVTLAFGVVLFLSATHQLRPVTMATAIACALRTGKPERPLIAQNTDAARRRHRGHCRNVDRGRRCGVYFPAPGR